MSEEMKPVAWRWRSPGYDEGCWQFTDVEPKNPQDHIEYQPLYAHNTLIEEQAARIAELEKERDVAWESREWHRVSMECQTENLIESQARLSEAVKVIEEMRKWLDYLPSEYPDDAEMVMALSAKAKAFIATLGENKN